MARVVLPYLNIYRVDGASFVYYRRGTFRVRLRGALGSADFLAAYSAAQAAYDAQVKAAPAVAAKGHAAGTLGALMVAYRRSAAWARLSLASKRDYEKGLGWLERHAHRPVVGLERKHVISMREDASWDTTETERRHVPSRANKMLAVLSILMESAIDAGMRRDNPARGVKKNKLTGEGFRPWTESEVRAFLAKASPMWSRALKLALCTGQRGQDLVRMEWSDFDGTAIRVRELKSRGKAPRWIPCHRELRAALRATPTESRTGTLITRADGSAWPLSAFQKAAGAQIRAAGITGAVWHGLRATAASRLAEAGCSDAEIMSITGHSTTKMVQHYRRGADQRRLATTAIARLPKALRAKKRTPID